MRYFSLRQQDCTSTQAFYPVLTSLTGCPYANIANKWSTIHHDSIGDLRRSQTRNLDAMRFTRCKADHKSLASRETEISLHTTWGICTVRYTSSFDVHGRVEAYLVTGNLVIGASGRKASRPIIARTQPTRYSEMHQPLWSCTSPRGVKVVPSCKAWSTDSCRFKREYAYQSMKNDCIVAPQEHCSDFRGTRKRRHMDTKK